jgi:hypothetical protein
MERLSTMIVLVVVGSESMEEPSRPAREAAFWMMDWTVTVFTGAWSWELGAWSQR